MCFFLFSINGGTPKSSKSLDHFSIVSRDDLEIPHLKETSIHTLLDPAR